MFFLIVTLGYMNLNLPPIDTTPRILYNCHCIKALSFVAYKTVTGKGQPYIFWSYNKPLFKEIRTSCRSSERITHHSPPRRDNKSSRNLATMLPAGHWLEYHTPLTWWKCEFIPSSKGTSSLLLLAPLGGKCIITWWDTLSGLQLDYSLDWDCFSLCN